MARQKLSKEELQKRQDFLKAETIEERTIRVLNPRINRLRKNMNDLAKAFNSPRYVLNEVQQEELIIEIESAYTKLKSAIEGSKDDDEIVDVL